MDRGRRPNDRESQQKREGADASGHTGELRRNEREGEGWQRKENSSEGNLRLTVVGRRGWGELLQTDSTGNSGVAGVQPSIKCN